MMDVVVQLGAGRYDRHPDPALQRHMEQLLGEHGILQRLTGFMVQRSFLDMTTEVCIRTANDYVAGRCNSLEEMQALIAEAILRGL